MRRGAPARPLALVAVALVCLVGSVAAPPGARPGVARPAADGGAARSAVSATPATPVPTSAVGPVPGPGDWPSYMGSVEHTGANLDERTIAPSNASELGVAWTLATNGSARSAPLVVNGTVYFGDWAGEEYAVSGANGSVVWNAYLGHDPDCYVGGIDSAPIDINGTLYLGAPNGSWDALNAATGAVDWTYFAGAPAAGYYDWQSGVAGDGSLYVGTASCDDDPLVAGQLFAVNLSGPHTANHTWSPTDPGEPGTTLWTTPTFDPAANELWESTGNDNGTPQPYAQSIVALNASTLAVLGSWQVPNVVGEDADFGSTPTLAAVPGGPTMVVATDKNGVTYGFDADNVTASGWGPAWQDPTGSQYSGAAFDGTTLYVAAAGPNASGAVWAVDPANGDVDWRADLPAGVPIASLTYANGLVVASAWNVVYVLDAGNGSVLWSHRFVVGSEIDGESAVSDGRLYVPVGNDTTGTGSLWAFGVPLAARAEASTPDPGAPWDAQLMVNVTGGMEPYDVDWSFGDGGAATGGSVTHVYSSPGEHEASYSVTDAAGATVNGTVAVTTSGVPKLAVGISASVTLGEAPFPVTFRAQVVNGSGPPYAWNWSIGGTPRGADASWTHVFTAPGTTLVGLAVVAPGGEAANASVAITAVERPTVTILAAPSAGPAPLAVALRAVVVGGYPPFDVAWSFGDGTPNGSGRDVDHRYAVPGEYRASVTVTDGLGTTVGAGREVAVTSGPNLTGIALDRVVAAACPGGGTSVAFTLAARGGVAPYAVVWSFGDGSTAAAGLSTTHVYAAPGSYAVTYLLTDSRNASWAGGAQVVVPKPACAPALEAPGGGTGVTPAAGAVLGPVAVAVAAVVGAAAGTRRRAPPPRG